MRYSKVKVFVLMFTLIMGNYFWAQIGMGQWRMHVASAQAIDVAVVENTVFTAFKNGVFVYNSETEEDKALPLQNINLHRRFCSIELTPPMPNSPEGYQSIILFL